MNLDKLRRCIKSGKYEWKQHTLTRIIERGIPLEAIIKVILQGDVIEDYPSDRPFPSCLMFSLIEGKPIHVVVSLDEQENTAYIITVYEPSLDKFEPDYKTRKK
ncbi:MAG: DUF4258 domain-containing protein [Candidatus Dadabacteria bacterium]|nr:DUF4258 domain-containing protein [Candidatus Dadabacteria bacterium]